MKFECNCTNEMEFAKMVEVVHGERYGYNFEVGAAGWYGFSGVDKTIMVEYQITTQECRDIVGEDEPDWLTAYEVEDENDYDCSKEIFMQPIGEVKLEDLEKVMADFAQEVFERFYIKED